MSARSAERLRRVAVVLVVVFSTACRRGDTRPLPPPGAPPGGPSNGEATVAVFVPPAVRLALDARREAKSAKWRNERPMMLRVVAKAKVPEPTTDDGALDPSLCEELCLGEDAKCWAVDAHAPAYTPKKRRPAVDCTDGHSVSITEADFAALEKRASDRQELDAETCRERCKVEGCFLAGYEPVEVQPVRDDERLVLCGATKIVGDAPKSE